MKFAVTVLGTLSPNGTKSQNCPGFWVQDGEHNILLDCGSGTHKMVRFPEILNNLHIFITHLHGDHYSDIINYQFASHVYKGQKKIDRPINIYLPQTPVKKAEVVKEEENAYAEYADILPDSKFKIGNTDVQFCQTVHPYETYAVKLENNGRKIVYTSDTSFAAKDRLVEFAQGADLLISESSLIRAHGFPEVNPHLTAYQAATIAKEANVGILMLTHFWPKTSANRYVNEAKEVFPRVIQAREGYKIDFEVNRSIEER